jgi:ethanolamine utilization microcompartment shell protein EutS
MHATLSGAEETPAVVLTGAVATVEAAIDATNREVSVTLRVFNIPDGAPTTAGHFHVGAKGAGGPVVLNFPSSIAGRTGDFTMTFRLSQASFIARPAQGINTIDDMIQAMVAGNAYANVHTAANPGGEIRGQLQAGPLAP